VVTTTADERLQFAADAVLMPGLPALLLMLQSCLEVLYFGPLWQTLP
jgi:hypothetical protein